MEDLNAEKPRLVSTDEEKALGQQIIIEELGENFRLIFDFYPPNIGLKGDDGVYGETVEIEMIDGEPMRFYVENYELIAKASNRITNEIPSVTKVNFFFAKLEE